MNIENLINTFKARMFFVDDEYEYRSLTTCFNTNWLRVLQRCLHEADIPLTDFCSARPEQIDAFGLFVLQDGKLRLRGGPDTVSLWHIRAILTKVSESSE